MEGYYASSKNHMIDVAPIFKTACLSSFVDEAIEYRKSLGLDLDFLILVYDSVPDDCLSLYEYLKLYDISMVINGPGLVSTCIRSLEDLIKHKMIAL
jgi:hypothetical protein